MPVPLFQGVGLVYVGSEEANWHHVSYQLRPPRQNVTYNRWLWPEAKAAIITPAPERTLFPSGNGRLTVKNL
jgi:hypothetical protein